MGLRAAVSALTGLDTLGKKIADPSDKGVVARTGRAVCDLYGSNGGLTGLALVGAGGYLGVLEACGRYWDDLPADPPKWNSPFEGGQCNTSYRIVAKGMRVEGIESETRGSFDEIEGRITSIRTIPNSVDPNYVSGIEGFNEFGYRAYAYFGGNQSIKVIPSSVVLSVKRLDGQPDNCGDPPPDLVTDPNYPKPRKFGEPFDVGEGGELDPWTFTQKPDGTISGSPTGGNPLYPPSFPGVDFPDFSVEGEGGGGDEGIPPSFPVKKGDPVTPPQGVNSGEEGEPEKPEGSDENTVCIGYSWDGSDWPTSLGKIIDTDTVFPFVWGNLQLKLKDSEGGSFVGDNLRLYSSRGCITTPYEGVEVVGLIWQKNASFKASFTPLFVTKDDEGIQEV